MNVHSDWWQLPTPEAYVRRVRECLRDGRSVLVVFPTSAPSGFSKAMADQDRRSISDWAYHQRISAKTVHGDRRGSPALLLHQQVGASLDNGRTSSAWTLVESEEFHGGLIEVSDLCPVSWPIWCVFIKDYAQASRSLRLSERTCFCLTLRGFPNTRLPDEDVNLAICHWSQWPGRIEMASYVHKIRLVPESVNHHKLAVTLIVELAGPDPELAYFLADADLASLTRPLDLIHRFLDEFAYGRRIGTSAHNATELVYDFDGDSFIHAADLAGSGNNEELRHRVWRAQVQVIFPMIEERRVQIIRQVTSHLPPLPIATETGVVDDVLDLEIGALDYYIRQSRAPRWAKQRIAKRKRIRNDLAHLRSVDPDELVDLL